MIIPFGVCSGKREFLICCTLARVKYLDRSILTRRGDDDNSDNDDEVNSSFFFFFTVFDGIPFFFPLVLAATTEENTEVVSVSLSVAAIEETTPKFRRRNDVPQVVAPSEE